MKRAICLIAATVLTTSVFSQNYDSSSAGPQEQQQYPAQDYESRQSESGAPAKGESGSVSGYDQQPSTGGNSSTGQSDGSNIADSTDPTATTRDSAVSSDDYRGTVDEEESLRSTDSVDGNFHEPAEPVREGARSEGWSGAGTFSGAGPGAVSDSSSSGENPESYDAEIQGHANFSHLGVGGPAQSEAGAGSSSSSDSAVNMDMDYARDLQMRVQSNWGGRVGMDIPANNRLFDQPMDDKISNGVGGFGSNVSGSSKSSDHNDECDTNKGSAAESEVGKSELNDDASISGSVRSSGSAIDHDERLRREQEKYPSEYGDRSFERQYRDGHLNRNNAAGNSGQTQSAGDSSAGDESPVTPPEL